MKIDPLTYAVILQSFPKEKLIEKIIKAEDRLGRALDIIDHQRIFYHVSDKVHVEVQYFHNEEEQQKIIDEGNQINQSACEILVECERYKQKDLFWTEEALAKAKEDAKKLFKDIFEDSNGNKDTNGMDVV